MAYRYAAAVVFLLLAGCALWDASGRERIGMANPASVYCAQSGYRLEIRTGADGGQHGACLFPDGAECEEWAFFRNECGSRYRRMPDTLPDTTRSGQR